jgi:hypothetical protein
MSDVVMRQVLQEQQLDRPADCSLVLKGADPLRSGGRSHLDTHIHIFNTTDCHFYIHASASCAHCGFIRVRLSYLLAGMHVSQMAQLPQKVPRKRKASSER